MQTHPIIIDCDSNPVIPDRRWKIISHRKNGQLAWDPGKIELILPEAQKTLDLMPLPAGWGKSPTGRTHRYRVNVSKLHEEMESMDALNANILDFLLENPSLIPEEWKKKQSVRFWGTIYDFGGPCVRYLRWRAGKWDWGYTSICGKGIDFDAYRRWFPAAILKAA